MFGWWFYWILRSWFNPNITHTPMVCLSSFKIPNKIPNDNSHFPSLPFHPMINERQDWLKPLESDIDTSPRQVQQQAFLQEMNLVEVEGHWWSMFSFQKASSFRRCFSQILINMSQIGDPKYMEIVASSNYIDSKKPFLFRSSNFEIRIWFWNFNGYLCQGVRIFDLKYDRAEEVGTNREMIEMPQSFPLPETKMEV